MKKTILIIVLFSIAVLSCKKDDKSPATSTTNTAPPVDGTPSNATTFNGIFTCGSYTTSFTNNPPYVNENAYVYFSNTATQHMNSVTGIPVGKVYINNDTLTYSSSYKYYNSYNPVNLATETWSVVGANGIGSFSISINAITPACSPIAVPDSISKSSGFSVNINNVTNIEKASVMVLDGSSTITGFVSKNLSIGNNTVNFSSSELNLLATTNSAYFVIILSSDKAYYFSGKSYQFVREAQLTKEIKIKP